jgi:Ion channel
VIALLSLGLLPMVACLALQVLACVLGARYFARTANRPLGARPWRAIFRQFSILMIVLMLGNIVQIAIWAMVYRTLGAFADFETALYFSGVTFTSLGYGDVVLSGRVRLLAPLQAANGLMMFGITTAAFIATIQRTTGTWTAEHRPGSKPDDRRGPPARG